MPKIITTGQGGALVTNDDDLATRFEKLRILEDLVVVMIFMIL